MKQVRHKASYLNEIFFRSPCNDAKQSKRFRENDDDRDGMQCIICIEFFETNGGHTLVSLKCGHLFGNSCIRQ